MPDNQQAQPMLMAIHPSTSTANVHGNGNYSDEEGPKPLTVSQVPFPPFQKLANPGPLGLITFALTTFVLGLYQCGAG